MAKSKRKASTPLLLFWSKQDQRRFIDGLERFQAAIHDLEALLSAPKRRAEAAAATRKAREAQEAAGANGALPLTPIEAACLPPEEDHHGA